jgi:hypothetical protein
VFFLGIGRLALRLARFLLPSEDRATTATAALALLAACWTVAATALGHFGALTPRAVLLLTAFALLASALRPAPPNAPRERTPGATRGAERTAILVAAAFFALSTAAAVFSQRNVPPGARSFDDTSYHLTAVATWVQAHDLRSVKFPAGDGSTAFYPIAGELFSFLLLVPFGGNDLLARWSEVPFALGSLVALAALARLLRLGEGAAGLAVLLYAASPRVFPTGMLAAGNDHAVCFFVLSSACSALLLRRGADPRRALFLGASLGMLVGTKYTGAMFLPPLLVLTGVCAAAAGKSHAEPRTRRAAALSVLAGAATLLVVGGYAYLRNAVGAGNPFYPATVRAFGRVVFRGWAGDTVGGLWNAGSSGGESLRFLWERVDLLGPLFRWLLLPAAVLAPLVAFVSWAAARVRRAEPVSDRSASAAEVVLFALPALLYLTFVRLMADHRDIRYVFAALALAALAAPWLVERLPPRGARLGRIAMLLAVSATLIAGARASFLADSRESAPEPDAAAAFLDRTAPAGTTIAFCGGNQPYLFFGRRLQNPVLYVPTYRGPGAPGGLNPPLGASYFSWRGSLEFPRHRAVRDEWRENLRQLNVGFVVVVRTGDEFPERDWIAAEPEAFTRVFRDARTEVFAFRDAPRRADRLRIDFARPESDYFRQGGADIVLPALDAPATAFRLEMQGGAAASMRLNGVPLVPVGPDAYRVAPSAWRRGRNRISIETSEGRAAPLDALELTLGAAYPDPGGGSGELLGNVDVPSEDALIRGATLAASGWCREQGGGRVDPVRFTIDGRDVVPIRITRPDRPDVVAAIPAVAEPKETGFVVELDIRGLSPGAHELAVEVETPDGRRRTLPARSFKVVR